MVAVEPVRIGSEDGESLVRNLPAVEIRRRRWHEDGRVGGVTATRACGSGRTTSRADTSSHLCGESPARQRHTSSARNTTRGRSSEVFCAAWSWRQSEHVLDRSACIYRLPDVASAVTAPASSAKAPRHGIDETVGHRHRRTSNGPSGFHHSSLRERERRRTLAQPRLPEPGSRCEPGSSSNERTSSVRGRDRRDRGSTPKAHCRDPRI